MSRPQIRIAWTFGTALSVLLFLLGVVAPAGSRGALNELKARSSHAITWHDERGDAELVALHEHARSNYYLGIAAPLAILGWCALITAGHRHERRNPRQGLRTDTG